jgi:hypothetical protein
MHDKVMVGLSGLNTDVHTFSSLLKYRVNMYALAKPFPPLQSQVVINLV